MTRVRVTQMWYFDVDEEADDESLDSVLNTGIRILEDQMRRFMPKMKGLVSGWRIDRPSEPERALPTAQYVELDESMLDERQYIKDPHSARETAKYMIENDLDQGISFTEDILQSGRVGRVVHPWDQGARVFPMDHPLATAETAALARRGMLCDKQTRIEEHDAWCVLVSGHSGGCCFKTQDQITPRGELEP